MARVAVGSGGGSLCFFVFEMKVGSLGSRGPKFPACSEEDADDDDEPGEGKEEGFLARLAMLSYVSAR